LAAGAAFIFPEYSLAANVWFCWSLLRRASKVCLLCNMLDGMVAIEGGGQTKSGESLTIFPTALLTP